MSSLTMSFKRISWPCIRISQFLVISNITFYSVAFFADSIRTLCGTYVFRSVFMPHDAMSLSGVNSLRRHASQNILSLSNRFQMVRINTVSNPTKMINGQIFGNNSFDCFIGNPVSTSVFTVKVKTSIPEPEFTTQPKPTRFCFINFGPKFFYCVFCFSHISFYHIYKRKTSYG